MRAQAAVKELKRRTLWREAYLIELHGAIPRALVLPTLALRLQQALDSFERGQDWGSEDTRRGTLGGGGQLSSWAAQKNERTCQADPDEVKILVGVLLTEELLPKRIAQEAQRIHRGHSSERSEHTGRSKRGDIE